MKRSNSPTLKMPYARIIRKLCVLVFLLTNALECFAYLKIKNRWAKIRPKYDNF